MKTKTKINIISISLSVIATILITFLFLLFLGKDPFEIFSLIYWEVFTSGYGIGQTLFKTTPLIFCGCGLAICFQANLFNIGAEGQLNAGAFVIAIVAAKLSPLGILVTLPASLLCGFIVSGFFGFIPAVIKIKKGVSEVITTIMLNFIVLALINFFLLEYFAVESTMHTARLPDNVMFGKLSEFFPSFQGSALNISFFLAITLAVLLYIFIYKTQYGYKLRAVGFNPVASKYTGLKVNKILITAFVVGAGLTSLAGLNYIFGYKGFYEFGFSNNIGFTAIAVALLAKNNPVGVIFSALLFGILDHGGLAINQIVPKEIVLVIQGVIILSILSIDKLVHLYFRKKGALFA